MTQEHYCKVHNAKYYQHENRGETWWSHKIGDTGKFCREDAGKGETIKRVEEAVARRPQVVEELFPEKPKGDTKSRSMALAYAKDLAVAGKIELLHIQQYADIFLRYIEG